MATTGKPEPAWVAATETFATELDGRVFYVRTGDTLRSDHPAAQVHPERFDHAIVDKG
jgi:hypothetical protein